MVSADGGKKRRDQGLGPDDRFMWIMDTFNDGRTAYFFENESGRTYGWTACSPPGRAAV